MLRTLLPALLAPCLLAACVNETVIPEATNAAAPRRTVASAAPTPPPAPVTEFDGQYAGRITLNPDRSRACPAAPASDLTITVKQGRGSFLIDPANQRVLVGTVGSSGDVRMADALDRTIATTGIFDRGRFIGEHKVGRCTYAVSMSKRD
ncbi:hypothetical protein [Roseicella aquatilis]|uniref:Uncharacterized protein n=1 Tax=Roseicella aquatilis TaxID=2527868 RepID=A0A4R4DQD2_9PROT|nr:hypothetical protein [Roseicella aquatilis]TCZ63293.1 hypothetical protein EXY23_10745 [Roseicella aquatilis]